MACKNLFRLIAGGENVRRYIRQVTTLAASTSCARMRLSSLGRSLQTSRYVTKPSLTVAVSVLSWLGFRDGDEQKESELIMTLKRAVLCIQREQFDKAEQMLHLALRVAQQQQNEQGVLYCYDLMANLAMDTFQLDKAEKLFVSVLQMLLSGGTNQKDLRVIHISLKLARISQLKADLVKADVGYKWCLEQVSGQTDNNVDAQMLCGIIHDWYAQFLLDIGDNAKAVEHLKQAYEACGKTTGRLSEQSMLLLNDIGTTYFRAGDLENAQRYLNEAVSVGRHIEDKVHVGVVHANLGLTLLQKGVANEAEKYCNEGWILGRKYDNTESVQQASYCLDQIKLALGK